MRRIGCAALAFALVGCGRLGYEASDAGGPSLDAGVDDAGGADGGVDASVADASPADLSLLTEKSIGPSRSTSPAMGAESSAVCGEQIVARQFAAAAACQARCGR